MSTNKKTSQFSLVESYNQYRADNGTNARERSPVTKATVRRYVNGYSEQSGSVPKAYKQFIHTLL